MSNCSYCGEESVYKPLIPKPTFFVNENYVQPLVNIEQDRKDLICLDCLDFELEELKVNY